MVRQGNAEPRFKYLPSSHRCYRIGEVARAGLAVLLAIVFAAAPLCSTSFAGNGTVTTIPRAAAAAKHGLQMDVDTRGVDGNGYRPVRIRVYTSNGRPSGSDRTLLVEFSPNGNYGYGQQQVSKRITLARGAFSAEMTMLVRQSASTANLRTAVYESGHRIPEMNSTAVIANGGEETEMWPSMLHIDSRAPRRNQLERIRRGGGKGPVHAEFVDFRALAQLSPAVKFTRTSKPNALPAATLHPNDPKARTTDVLNGLRDAPMCDLIPLTELPDNWLALSTYDLTFISIEDLEKLQATPKTALALEHWTRAGHSLYVYDAKKSPVTEGLRRVDSVLQGGFSGWQVGTVSDDDRIEEYNTHSSRNGNRAKKTLGAINKNRTCDFLRIRDCGLGRVVYVSGDPYEMTYRDRVAVMNVVGIRNWAWRERAGVSMTSTNSVFWRNLIPGVGLPPVNSFLIVMTMFVITVGPASYFFFKRTKRLFLIMVVTPLASIAMLCGLLVFAIVSDGFGVRTQVRGLTFLDSKTGRVSSVSYQTYYSSIGGAAELRFPTDASVFPVKYQPRDYRRRDRQSLTEWDSSQRLTGSYLRPRTMTQFLVARSASSSMYAKMAVKGGTLEFTNGLQAPVEFVIARHGDRFYKADDVAPGDVVVMLQAEILDLAESTRQRYDEAELTTPDGWDEAAFLRFSRNYWDNSADYGFGPPKNDGSLLERRMRSLMLHPLQGLPHGGFVAVVEQSRAIPMGVANSRRQSGLEIIYGRWK